MSKNIQKHKILIVEDESIVALDLRRTVEKLGFEVTCVASDCNTTLNSIRVDKPDIILMDINLKNSNKDGIEIAEKIQITEQIPIIYSTAYSDESTIQRAIKTNPVSYLIKPYKEDDIKSNILLGIYKKFNLRSSFYNKSRTHIGFGYYFDSNIDKLYFRDKLIKLSSKETVLLKILINARGKYVELNKISAEIWEGMEVSDSTLRTLIYRLRAKLEYKVIETSIKLGCRLNYRFSNPRF